MAINNLGLFFQENAKRYANHIAIEFPNGDIKTYQQLNQIVNQTSRFLIGSFKISNGDVVCISGLKKIETFCMMLACLKIGAIYSVFDSDSPINRVLTIFSSCQPKLIVAEAGFIDLVQKKSDVKKIAFLENNFIEKKLVKKFSSNNFSEVASVNINNPAYIMFTSGSTGIPKGAVISHANLISFISWSKKEYGFSANDKLTNVNPLFFDNSVFDFYSSIFSGATLVPFSKNEVSNPALLMQKINEIGCTSWFSVPSLLIYLEAINTLVPENMQKINRFIFGGEAYPKSKLIKLFKLYSHRAEIYNVYGPTECTCICSNYKISAEDFNDLSGLAPLGNLIENFNYLILNDKLEPVMEDEIGELCLLGPNVGLGYFND
jgi:D-alanine--poly(phosphoribitol) ligase subunit 1